MTEPPLKPAVSQRMSVILFAVLDAARGRPAGLQGFANTPASVLAAMTPLVAFMLVGAAVALLGPHPGSVMLMADVALALLGSLVVSYELAAAWGKADRWCRFAAAYCWCQWAAPLALAATILLMAGLMALGVEGNAAQEIGLLAMLGYAFWLHWFLARHALDLSGGRALALVLVVSVAAAVLMSVPDFGNYLLNGPPPG